MEPNGIKVKLKTLPDWKIQKGMLSRLFLFRNYEETTYFVNQIADLGRLADHHPEITFSFNRCQIRIWTDSVKALTEKDFQLAEKIQNLKPR